VQIKKSRSNSNKKEKFKEKNSDSKRNYIDIKTRGGEFRKESRRRIRHQGKNDHLKW
jgi:hypothetical protein